MRNREGGIITVRIFSLSLSSHSSIFSFSFGLKGEKRERDVCRSQRSAVLTKIVRVELDEIPSCSFFL